MRPEPTPRPAARAALLALLALAACRPLEGQSGPPPKVRPAVHLPETPPLEVPERAPQDTSGAFTVAGLFAAPPDKGQDITVSALVISRHLCPPPAPEAPAAPPCYPPPHLLLADERDGSGSELLVAGTNEQVEALPLGDRASVRGKFVQWSDDQVFVRSEGLIQLEPPPADLELAPIGLAPGEEEEP